MTDEQVRERGELARKLAVWVTGVNSVDLRDNEIIAFHNAADNLLREKTDSAAQVKALIDACNAFFNVGIEFPGAENYKTQLDLLEESEKRVREVLSPFISKEDV